MKFSFSRIVSLALGLTLLASAIARADDAAMVDNPAYLAWKSHKVGTTVTYTTEVRASDHSLAGEMVSTLVEVTNEAVTIEVSRTTAGTATNGNTGPRRLPKVKSRIPAKVAADKVELPPEVTSGTTKESGHESLDLAGKTYDCTVYDIDGKQTSRSAADNAVKGKVYFNKDVPGGLVKSDLTSGSGDRVREYTTVLSKIEDK